MKTLSLCSAFLWLAATPILALHYDRFQIASVGYKSRLDDLKALSSAKFPAYNFSLPVDHFHNDSRYEPHSDHQFNNRYWFDAQYYKPGGPVIVLAAGEVSGATRLDFLERGIAHILAKATNGIAVILEHRYYGTSYPVPDTGLDNLRFLSTEQALADTAYFAENMVFPGLEQRDLTASNTPWIIYGGSYAGIFAALARKIYPDTFWGGISSSGVPQVVLDYWQYNEAARLNGPGACANISAAIIDLVDQVLLTDDKDMHQRLKTAFALPDLEAQDFAETVVSPMLGLQGTNWNPNEAGNFAYGDYCGIVQSSRRLYSSVNHLEAWVADFVKAAGHESDQEEMTTIMLNYIGVVRKMVTETMSTACEGMSSKQCFDRFRPMNSTAVSEDGWIRSWTYQTCTQWGFFLTGASVPDDRLRLYSRLIDLEFAMGTCREVFDIHTMPDTDSINKYGGFDFSHHRLAFIDGAQDPWREAGAHAAVANDRKSTDSEPFLLVDPGVHHWDEYGAKEEDKKTQPNFPPKHILGVQQEEIRFVKVWLKEFEEQKGKKEFNQMTEDL